MRNPKVKIVEVNDKASLEKVVDKGMPERTRLNLIRISNGDRGFSFGFAERNRNDVLDNGRLYHWNKLDQPVRF